MRHSLLGSALLMALAAWGCSERLDDTLRPGSPMYQFSQGQSVQTTTGVDVHSAPNNFSSSVGPKGLGATGTIQASPGTLDPAGDNTIYWQVAFSGGPTGWVSGVYLAPGTGGSLEFWVAPSGGQGAGTQADPWSLSWAMDSANHAVVPGSTIWMTNGTYTGNVHATVVGTSSQRIVYRQVAGARATIDGELWAQGAYITFQGFEIKQANPSTLYGVRAQTNNGRFVNLVIHDVGTMGVSIWFPPGDTTEVYGSIIYNNGTHNGLDHGAFIESTSGYRILRDNVFFNNTSEGIHAFTAAGNPTQNNIYAIGNVSFNNGSTAYAGWGYTAKPNLLLGGAVVSNNMRADSNFTYYSINPTSEYNLKLGYGSTNNLSLLARGNTSWGGIAVVVRDWSSAAIQGNTLWTGQGRLVDLFDSTALNLHSWSGNTYLRPATAVVWWWKDLNWYNLANWQSTTGLGTTGSSATIPATATTIVRANKYEAGRALIIVNNDAGNGSARQTGSITVNLPAGILTSGQAYSIHNVQAFYTTVSSGTYNGTSISITSTAMAGGVPPALLGSGRTWGTTPPTTGPRFNAFILTSP